MEALLATWSPIAIISFALSPIFIALCALVATVWSGWAQRHHNRLSVEPRLGVELDPASLRIESSGLGPARIGSIEAVVRGNSSYINTLPDIEKCFDELFAGLAGFVYACTENAGGAHILPGANSKLVSFKVDDGADPNTVYKSILNALKGLELRIEYESMYGEPIEPVMHQL